MYDIRHQLHVVTNELKGLEAGYGGRMEGIIFLRTIEDNTVYKVTLETIGEVESNDMSKELEILPTVKNNRANYQLMKKWSEYLGLLKNFETGYTSENWQTLLIQYHHMLYRSTIREMGEGKIEDYLF